MNYNNSIIIDNNFFNSQKYFKKKNLSLSQIFKPHSSFFYLPKEISNSISNNKSNLKFKNFQKKKFSIMIKDKTKSSQNNVNKIKKESIRKSISLNGNNPSLNSLNFHINKKIDNSLQNNDEMKSSYKFYSFKKSYSNDILLNNENNILNFKSIKNYFKNKFEKYKKKIGELYNKTNKNINKVYYLYDEFPIFIANTFLNQIKLFNSQHKNLEIFCGKIENILNVPVIKHLFFEEIIHKIIQRNICVNFQNLEIIKKDILNIIKKEFSYFINVGKNMKKESNKVNYIFPIKEFINIYGKNLKKKRTLDKDLFKTFSNLTIKKYISRSSSTIDLNKENDKLNNIAIEKDLTECKEKIKIKELKRRNKEDELMKIFIESEKIYELKNLSDDNIIKKKKCFDSNDIISKDNNLFFYKFHSIKKNEKKLRETLNIQSISQSIKNKYKKIFFEYDEQKSKFEKEKKYILNKIVEHIKNLKSLSINNQKEIDFCEHFQNKIILLNHKKNNDYNLLKDEFKKFRKKLEKIKNNNFIKSRNFHLIKKRNNSYDYHYIFPKMANKKFQYINRNQFVVINSNKNNTVMSSS